MIKDTNNKSQRKKNKEYEMQREKKQEIRHLNSLSYIYFMTMA